MLVIKHPDIYRLKDFLPFEAMVDGKPLPEARVTLTGGEGAVFQSKKTSPEGRASFSLPDSAA